RRRRASRAATRHGACASTRARRSLGDDRRSPRIARAAARAGGARPGGGPRRRAVAAELRQAARRAPAGSAEPGAQGERWLAQLVVAALAWRLVLAPAQDLRAVADAPVADVVIADLDDELGAQLDPLEVAVCAPAARLAAAARPGLVGPQALEQLALLSRVETRAVADDAELPIGLVQSQDKRPDAARGLAGAVAGNHAVDRSLALDLDHRRALAGGVGGVEALRDHALGLAQPGLGLTRV